MKKLFTFAAAAAVTIGIGSAATAQDFRMLSSWDETNHGVSLLAEPFMADLEERTDGRMTFVRSGPETVPPFEQLQPVSVGLFDFLFTHGAYHFGTTPLGATLDALSGSADDHDEAGVRDWLDQHYQKLGLKLIAAPTTQKHGYQLILRQPLTEKGNLEGRKIRATRSYFGVLDLLGASPVTLPASEVYSALEKGVVDGAAWPALGLEPTRWYEIAGYVARPTFGHASQLLFMNLNKWNSLSAEDQQLILDAGKRIEGTWFTEFDRMAEEEEQRLVEEQGLKIEQLPEQYASEIQNAWNDGIWSNVASQRPEETEELREIARKAGLTN